MSSLQVFLFNTCCLSSFVSCTNISGELVGISCILILFFSGWAILILLYYSFHFSPTRFAQFKQAPIIESISKTELKLYDHEIQTLLIHNLNHKPRKNLKPDQNLKVLFGF